jgi:hypothetical protein
MGLCFIFFFCRCFFFRLDLPTLHACQLIFDTICSTVLRICKPINKYFNANDTSSILEYFYNEFANHTHTHSLNNKQVSIQSSLPPRSTSSLDRRVGVETAGRHPTKVRIRLSARVSCKKESHSLQKI